MLLDRGMSLTSAARCMSTLAVALMGLMERRGGGSLVTLENTGKAYFMAWSMDVKIEGDNVDRSLDMMTHNHMQTPGNTPPWPYMA